MEKEKTRVSLKGIKDSFSGCYDYTERKMSLGGEGGIEATVCFLDGLVSGEAIAREVIKPATNETRFGGVSLQSRAIELFMSGVVYSSTAKLCTGLNETIEYMLAGFCAVVFDKAGAAVTFEVKSPVGRAVTEPKEEKVIKGAKDVFVEILKTNTMLVRRKIKSSSLKFKQVYIGEQAKTMAVIVYMENYTDMDLVREMEKRLEKPQTDIALSASSIEEYLEDRPKTPFPQMLRTERPDRFCMNILEGRVGLIVDGLPMGYLAPGTFSQFYKVPEDIANHFVVASIMNVMRYIALVITVLLPAFYVAVAMYHQEMLPTRLLLSIINSRQAVPFPAALEIIAMLAAFELLQEAGLRMPSTIGTTVSILGALIVGQAAVDAKVVSPIVVIVIALAGIAGYTVPDQDMSAALRVFRFLFVLAAIVGGLYGLVLAGVLLICHMCSIESFGISYMEPFSGDKWRDKLRAFLRLPVRSTKHLKPELDPERKEDESD